MLESASPGSLSPERGVRQGLAHGVEAFDHDRRRSFPPTALTAQRKEDGGAKSIGVSSRRGWPRNAVSFGGYIRKTLSVPSRPGSCRGQAAPKKGERMAVPVTVYTNIG
jgi:hypothetical protein